MYVFNQIGIKLPHIALKQSNLEGINKSLNEAAPGDLIFFGSRNENSHYTVHAGIVHSVYEEDIEVIHCVSVGVCIDERNSRWEYYWKDKVLFVKTLLGLFEINYQARN
ncbi:MAG: C40 family peptidase [Bacteroidetes bacterium]|nr:C40 family peptidase [Bacteroidota bacterium]